LAEEKVIAAKLVINYPQLNTLLQSRRNSPNSLLAKLTRDSEKRSELFETFDLSSPRRINNGGEAVASKTAQPFTKTLDKLFSHSNWSFVISVGFGVTWLVQVVFEFLVSVRESLRSGCSRFLPSGYQEPCKLSSLPSYIDSVPQGRKPEGVRLHCTPVDDKIPIFMVHPGVGEVLIFVKYFQNERSALSAPVVEPSHTIFVSMGEMVSTYAAAVNRTQPKGPYAVAG